MNADTLIALPQSFPGALNVGRLGRCMNHPQCDLALSGQVLVIEDRGQFLCPNCGGPLVAVAPRKAPSHHGRSAMIMAGSFAAAVALGVAVASMELSGNHPAAPVPASSSSAAPPVAALPTPQPMLATTTQQASKASPRVIPPASPVEQADLPAELLPAAPAEAPVLRNPKPVTLRAAPVPARPQTLPQDIASSPFATQRPAARTPVAEIPLPPPQPAPQPVAIARPLPAPVALAPLAPAPARPVQNPPVAQAKGQDRGFASVPVAGGQPSYPDELQASATRGVVNVSCLIDTQGRPTGCRVKSVRGHRAFSDVVSSWLNSGRVRFAPILRNGTAVAERHAWNVEFDPPASE